MNNLIKHAFDSFRVRAYTYLLRKFPLMTESIVLGDYHQTGPMFDMESYQRGYRIHPTIFTCVRTIADNFAQIPFSVYRKKVVNGKLQKETLLDHPVSQLLGRPSSFMSKYDIKKKTAGYLELDGNVYWCLIRGFSGKVQQIIALRPDRVTVVPEKEGYIKGYLYSLKGESFKFDESDIIHFKWFNPWDDYYGQSTMEAARSVLAEDMSLRKYNQNFLQNSAVPRGIVSIEATMSDPVKKRLREAWEKAYSGPENAHRIAFLDSGAKFQEIGMKHKDMEFVEGKKLNKMEIASVFGVPPLMLNDYERATYNNTREQVAFFWHETMIPKTLSIIETINLHLWKFESARRPLLDKMDIEIAPELSEVWALKEEELEQAEKEVKVVDSGIMTINEIRARRNLPPVEWGDVWHQKIWNETGAPPAQKRMQIEQGEEVKIIQLQDAVINEDEDEEELERHYVSEWKAFDTAAKRYEPLMQKYAEGVFDSQEKIVLKNLRRFLALDAAIEEQKGFEFDSTNGDHLEVKRPPRTEAEIETVLFNLEEAYEVTEEGAAELYKAMMKSGGRRGFTLARVSGTFNLQDPRAVKALKLKKQTFAKEVSDTTWNNLKSSLIAGVNEGESVQNLAQRVKATFKARRSDAYNIARTESIGTMNTGIMEGFRQTDLVEEKGWLSARDNAVRNAHREVEKQGFIPLDATFELTGPSGQTVHMQHPGDSSGGNAEQLCNCRCTLKPKLKKKRKR